MPWFLASFIVLAPVLDEGTQMRLAATDTDEFPVLWFVNGELVAQAESRQATEIWLPAGQYQIVAHSGYSGDWEALVRPSIGFESSALSHVEGWSGQHKENEPIALWPVAPFLVGIAMLVIGSRPKRP